MKAYKGFLTAVLLAAVLIGIGLCTEEFNKRCYSNEYALENLVAGIQSDNTGVKRSQFTLLVNTELQKLKIL